MWSGCARKLKEQGLLFLLSQTCWALLLGMALWEGKTAPQVSQRKRGSSGGGLGEAGGSRGFLLRFSLRLFWFLGGGSSVPHTVF